MSNEDRMIFVLIRVTEWEIHEEDIITFLHIYFFIFITFPNDTKIDSVKFIAPAKERIENFSIVHFNS